MKHSLDLTRPHLLVSLSYLDKAITRALEDSNAEVKLLGLSKYHRLLQWHFARPITQETATERATDHLYQLLTGDSYPRNSIQVTSKCVHLCACHRGVTTGHDSHMIYTAKR